MGLFRRAQRTGPPPASPARPRVAPQAVAVAAPDTFAEVRERSLRHQIGLSLQGQAGTIVGYDRGDPANSVTAVINRPVGVADAQAHVGTGVRYVDQAQIYDQATSNPELNAYQANLLQRITRR